MARCSNWTPFWVRVRCLFVCKCANVFEMGYRVEYFNPQVRKSIEKWPVGVLADYARLVELLMEFGPDLGMPYSRSMGSGLFELRPRGREGIGRALYCYVKERKVVVLSAFIKKSRATPMHQLRIARLRLKEIKNG